MDSILRPATARLLSLHLLSTPTEGDCTAVVGWHIDKGNLGAVDLTGLNVAMAVYTPGAMHLTKWRAALYWTRRPANRKKTH